MKLFLIIFLNAIPLTFNVSGQDDKESVKILDKFSSIALAAPSVSMKFSFITIDNMKNRNDTLPGSIILSKDKYKLELPDNTIWFNGETSWSYLPAEKEVTITRADKKDNSFQNRPSAIFSMYKNEYKSRLIEEGSESYIIDLYPKDIKSDLVRVRLVIGKSQFDLRSLEYKKKDGMIMTLIISGYNLKLKAGSEIFVFQPEKFTGVEIIDMR
jgi:outer membrane lipoprotein carrier protein